MKTSVRVITQPGGEPVTRQQCKDWMRETQSGQDSVIDLLIPACRRFGENETRRTFCQQILEQSMTHFPAYDLLLWRPPLREIVHVKYIDGAGVLQTMDAADYQVDTASTPGRIRPAYGKSWPMIRWHDYNPVQVRYVAGYPTDISPFDPSQVDANIRQWLLMKVATLYEIREEIIVDGTVVKVPASHCDGLLDAVCVDIF